MGIKGLTQIIAEYAPGAIKERVLKDFNGRKVAIDASMAIYQFLVAVRSTAEGGVAQYLMNEAGEATSHIQGMFSRTIKMMEYGIKPAYVFDGKPPDMKGGELEKRKEAKEKAEKEMKEAETEGDVDDVNRLSKRTVHMSKEHQDDCKKLLSLMGVPVIEAPSEAEAQCAALAKAGMVFAAASEDMDTLAFQAPFLLRRLTFSEARKLPVLEIDYKKVLDAFEMTPDQFIDFCMLCGCDYLTPIKGIGPKTAFKLIRDHKTLEAAIKSLDPAKNPIPEDFDYVKARHLFAEAEIKDPATIELKWTPPDEKGLTDYLVGEKGFNPERVAHGIERINKCREKGTQQRLESFFGLAPKPAEPMIKPGMKRKLEDKKPSKFQMTKRRKT